MTGCDLLSNSNLCAVFLTLILFFSGCVAPNAELNSSSDDDEKEQSSLLEAQLVPEWTAESHTGDEFNRSTMAQGAYIAYFSAPWCTHCEATLDAYDQVIPEGRMMIFSKEDNPDFTDMNQWHNTTENNLNRTISRPFMLHPDFASAMTVTSIPHVAFVNEQGYVYQNEIGKRTNQTMLSDIWNATLIATYNTSTGWS